jgi:hypothetical protein
MVNPPAAAATAVFVLVVVPVVVVVVSPWELEAGAVVKAPAPALNVNPRPATMAPGALVEVPFVVVRVACPWVVGKYEEAVEDVSILPQKTNPPLLAAATAAEDAVPPAEQKNRLGPVEDVLLVVA